MRVRHYAPVYKAECSAWRTFRAAVVRDYREAPRTPGAERGGGYVDPSGATRERGAAWLAAYRERARHCRRRSGG